MISFMKKIGAAILVLIMVLAMIPCAAVSAQESFVIENGILVSYTGSDREITIPSEVLYIGDNAFRDNTALEKVVLGKSVLGIGNCAFYGCTSLYSVEQKSVGAVGAYAFYNTPYLNSRKEEFVTINDVLIKYNGGSSNLVIPSDVRVISPYTFAYNRYINSVEIGAGVEEIGEGAFYMCGNLSEAEISQNTAVIGGYAFYGTPWLENDSREFIIEGKNILIACKSGNKNVEIPEGVVTVGTGAFYNSGLETVTFPETTRVIGMRSFMGCENLKEIEIPEGTLLIDVQAFYNCGSLVRADIAESVQVIREQAFESGELVIYGEKGSAAETFAENNGIPFNGAVLTGDADGNGIVNINDSTTLQKYISGFKGVSINLAAADVNNDGKVDVTDATGIQILISKI